MDESGKRILKALSYVFWPVGLVSFLIAEDDLELKFHGAQGLVFGMAAMILWYLFFGFFGWGFFVFRWIGNLILLTYYVFAVIFAIKAYKGERFRILLIYDLMRLIYKEETEKQKPMMKYK